MNILSATKNYKYISFDIFDTLISRVTSKPEEVFDVLESKLICENEVFKGFSKKRQEAARTAFRSSKKESTLDDIYEILDYKKEEKALAYNLEIDTEIEISRINGLLKRIIQELKSQGKKIVIISDMYLPAASLSKMLHKNEVDYDFLFVSSETQMRKSTGEMFDYVVKSLEIKKKDIIHIGDNLRSDYVMPLLKGIKAIHWTEKRYNHLEKIQLTKSSDSIALYSMLKQNTCTDYYEQVGYELYGPALLGFCQWIHRTKYENNLSGLCFLARDGQIVSKAYKILYPKQYPYFLASRRSLTVPLLKEVKNIDEIFKIIPYIKREESPHDLLYKLGVEDSLIEKQVKNLFDGFIKRTDLQKEKGLGFFEIVKEPMKKNATDEYKAALGYIKENLQPGRIGLVDIGWYGTMQQALERLCSFNAFDYEFYGLYFGLLEKADKTNNNIRAKGFVYDFNSYKGFDPELIFGFNGLIELMFTADHGSAKRYIQNESGYMCITEKEQGEYSEFVKKVQIGSLKFVNEFMKRQMNIEVDEKIAFSALQDLLIHPSKNESSILGKLKFYDAYFEEIVQFDGWCTLLRNPRTEIRRFLKSNWKIGYVAEMLPVKKPERIYRLLNKIKS